MGAKRIRVRTIVCPKCKIEMYSRAHHDFRSCKCGTFVDGGFDYLRVGWPTGYPAPVRRTRYVYVTRETLFEDWNRQYNRFGIINP